MTKAKCPVCGGRDHHTPIGHKGSLVLEPLTAEDFKELYLYTQKREREQLKFVHELIAKARNRETGVTK